MIKNLTSHQLLLIAIAAFALLFAAFAFYLLQNPSAPLPFSPPPATATSTALLPSPTNTEPETALIATRQTSYTPFAVNRTPNLTTPPAESPTASEPTSSNATSSPTSPTNAPATTPSRTPRRSTVSPSVTSTTSAAVTPSVSPGTPRGTQTTPSPTVSPGATATLSPGEFGVTGRILLKGTPVANVVVEFKDDAAPRQAITNQGGHYWFISLAPGTDFRLTFRQSENPGLTPPTEITSLAWIEGTLPTGVDIIDFPDFEVSVNLNGMIFELQSPTDGAAVSASAISASDPLPFVWSLYSLGGIYHIELGPSGSDEPVWSSGQLAASSYGWDGTLNDGSHISAGTYWWRVAVTKSLANYVEDIYTQQYDIQFNP